MFMKESLIESKICEYAKSKNWLTYKFVSPNRRGVPDRIFLRSGVIFFVEFKATKKQLRKLQIKIISRLQKQDFKVYVIDNVEKGLNLIDTFEK